MMTFEEYTKKDIAIYLDLDGVFADFCEYAARLQPEFERIRGLHSDMPASPERKKLRNELKDIIKDTPDFWVDLKWENGGPELFKFVSENFDLNKVAVLTAPMRGDMPRCKNDKWKWVQEKFDNKILKENFFVDHDKYKYVNRIKASKQILIDDRVDNIRKWKDAGGIGILHVSTNYKASIETLQQFI